MKTEPSCLNGLHITHCLVELILQEHNVGLHADKNTLELIYDLVLQNCLVPEKNGSVKLNEKLKLSLPV